MRRGLGVYPKSLLGTFGESKVPPRRVGVLIKPFVRLAPPKVSTDFFTNAPAAGGGGRYFAAGEIIPCLNGVGVVIL